MGLTDVSRPRESLRPTGLVSARAGGVSRDECSGRDALEAEREHLIVGEIPRRRDQCEAIRADVREWDASVSGIPDRHVSTRIPKGTAAAQTTVEIV